MMFGFWWRNLLTLLSISVISLAINRPVYKIVLNSKGYAQFIQYDIDVPPLSEFTLCVWVRVISVENEQSIFTYVGTDGKRIMRLWLDSGGRQLRISLENGRVTSSAGVQFTADAWRDVCVTYQSDLGAWALYVDAKLLLCEGSRNLRGFAFPGKGSLIVGYGTSERGFPTGLSGEIYGVSMILLSAIERNITIGMHNWNKPKIIKKNKFPVSSEQGDQYIVLGDLQKDDIQTAIPHAINKEYEFSSSDVTSRQLEDNMKVFSRHYSHSSAPRHEQKHEISIDENITSNKKNSAKDFNQIFKNNEFKAQRGIKNELTGSGTQDLPIVLEYETPPTISALTSDYSIKNSGRGKTGSDNKHDDIMISDVQKPPPPEHDTKVYGQWTSSKFASNVLSYLKNTNFNTNKKQKKVISTFSDGKFSDLYPYPSELSHTIIRPPINYKRRIHSTKRHYIARRDTKEHQINVQIINPDENDIIFPLKNVDPKLIEVTNRGEAKIKLQTSLQKSEENNTPFVSGETSNSKNLLHKRQSDGIINTSERHRGSDLMKILPFLKSKEYFENNNNSQSKNTNSRPSFAIGLSNDDQWREFYQKMADKADTHKHMQGSNGDSLTAGRALAKEVSNQAKRNIYNVPLLKYKQDPITPTSNTIAVTVVNDYDGKQASNQINFNKQVKLGNALNERFIGYDVHQIKNTFLGGDDSIPDINRHRSKSNSRLENIPASHETRVCKNVELYVHEDESIGKSKYESPLQRRNIGIEFVVQSYKRCSTNESPLKDSPFILIDWTRTPVKLFGGAYAKKTKDLCGFF
ncbi:uncharacterized protein LOC134679304 [Cydia fagiglandana]|uniref:uncharacterized protein LOC134679304 n=1 Tax=Cydia fagiglandana TaxID=1458189 RepID=UPI002FEE5B63